MGGQAFSTTKPRLITPRMPLDIYTQVLVQTHTVLRKYYSHVESAIEAPGKETYGDVDTLVYGPFDATWDDYEKGSDIVAEHLAKALGAKKFLNQRGNPTINFAIPWPEQEGDNNAKMDKYVQLDVHICFGLVSFKWELFHAAHGDLWNILGSTIRPFGLTVNDQGMYIRIPEVELYDRKRSMICLTSDPSQVLRFLGLDEDRWWTQFRNKNDMFEYAAGCRMFWVKTTPDAIEPGREKADELTATAKQYIDGQEGGERGKQKLKHNDRQRMAKRPVFKEWIDEFIPRCRERGHFGEAKCSREQIQQEAIAEFGVKDEYDMKLKEWKLIKHQDDLWRVVIKGGVPIDDVDPAFRAAALRTLKATIMEGVEFECAVPQAAIKDQEGFYDLEKVRVFVLDNWEKAGQIGLARQELKAREAMKAKTEKREREEENKKRKEVPI